MYLVIEKKKKLSSKILSSRIEVVSLFGIEAERGRDFAGSARLCSILFLKQLNICIRVAFFLAEITVQMIFSVVR